MSKYEYNNVLKQLQYYMFNSLTIQSKIKSQMNFKHLKFRDEWDEDEMVIKKPVKSEKPKKEIVFYPKEQDQLFWIFYIILNGNLEYECNRNNRFAMEQSIKYKYIDNLKMNKNNEKTLLKQSKIATLIQLEENLTDPKINESTFLSLCFLEHINIYLVTRNIYYKSISNDTAETFVVYCTVNKQNKNVYGFSTLTQDKLKFIEDNYYQVCQFAKPILSIGNYKVDELIQICTKLKIDILDENKKRKTKQCLYESLTNYLRTA